MSSLTAADVGDEALGRDRPPARLLAAPAGRPARRARRALRAGPRGGRDDLARPRLGPGRRCRTRLDDVLDATDVFLPNAAEACRLTGAGDPEAALAALAERVETVVVTLGAEGAIARRGDETARAERARGRGGRRDRRRRQPRRRLPLRPRRAGWALAEALRLGVACGSLSTRALGGVDAQPDLDEALELAGARGGRRCDERAADLLRRRRQRRVHRDADRRHPRLPGAARGARSRCTTSTPSGSRPPSGVARATARAARRRARDRVPPRAPRGARRAPTT